MLTFSADAAQASTLSVEGELGAVVALADDAAGELESVALADDAAPGEPWLPHAVTTSPHAATARALTVAARRPAPALANR
jgi:hypothetical protein